MKKIILLLLFICSFCSLYGQSAYESVTKVHLQDSNMLLNDMNIQIEVTEAVNNMYNGEFNKAEKEFIWLKYRFPEHPLPYFLLGLSKWWRFMPELDNVFAYDDYFIAYMDSAIYFANKKYEINNDDIEAAFFLAAAHAFKGRLYSERKSWTKAALAGKSSLNYLKVSRENNELSPEFLFGEGVYNYYRVWIPENYPMLKPLMAMFDEGNKALGKEQLVKTSRNAFYTRTEAQYFLMRILAIEENDSYGGLEMAKYLHETFPNNAYFQRFYARQLYVMGRFRDCLAVSTNMIDKIDSAYNGYGATSGRYAGFFLGQIYENYKDYDQSAHYYKRAIDFAESIKATDTGYYLYALLHLARVYEKQDKVEDAKEVYKKLKKVSNRKHSTFKEAKEKLREL